jgi:hypothetical protein
VICPLSLSEQPEMEVMKDAPPKNFVEVAIRDFWHVSPSPPPLLLRISGEPNPDVTKQAIEMCYYDKKQLYPVLGRGKSLKSKLWLYSF